MPTAKCWHVSLTHTMGSVLYCVVGVPGMIWLCLAYSKDLACQLNQYHGQCIVLCCWCTGHELAVLPTARIWHVSLTHTMGSVLYCVVGAPGMNRLCPAYSKDLACQINQYHRQCIVLCCWCTRHEQAMPCLQQGSGMSA